MVFYGLKRTVSLILVNYLMISVFIRFQDEILNLSFGSWTENPKSPGAVFFGNYCFSFE